MRWNGSCHFERLATPHAAGGSQLRFSAAIFSKPSLEAVGVALRLHCHDSSSEFPHP